LNSACSGERVLLDSLLAQVSRGRGSIRWLRRPSRQGGQGRKASGTFEARFDWAQKWLFDLTLASEGLPPRYFLAQAALLQRLAQGTDTRKLLAFNEKAIQYKAQCEQPLNSRLFLEDFFLSYARLFRTS
jgi:DNA polymerase-3 subunit delta'